MAYVTTCLRAVLLLLVAGTFGFDVLAESGRLSLSLMDAVTISNSLIALTVGAALAWGSLVFTSSVRWSAAANTDRVIATLLGIASLAWLTASTANIWGAHWLR
jgi:hypothetical protein